MLLFIFLDKPAKMSSVYNNWHGVHSYEAAMAVDGIYQSADNFASMANSQRETRPWWRVDLGNVHCVWAANILNRYTSKPHCLQTNKK